MTDECYRESTGFVDRQLSGQRTCAILRRMRRSQAEDLLQTDSKNTKPSASEERTRQTPPQNRLSHNGGDQEHVWRGRRETSDARSRRPDADKISLQHGGTIFCQKKQWLSAGFPQHLFHKGISKRSRVAAHTKTSVSAPETNNT